MIFLHETMIKISLSKIISKRGDKFEYILEIYVMFKVIGPKYLDYNSSGQTKID